MNCDVALPDEQLKVNIWTSEELYLDPVKVNKVTQNTTEACEVRTSQKTPWTRMGQVNWDGQYEEESMDPQTWGNIYWWSHMKLITSVLKFEKKRWCCIDSYIVHRLWNNWLYYGTSCQELDRCISVFIGLN